jgi:co-chaperonin GroES (HSP10)
VKITPRPGRYLLRRCAPAQETSGGIALPEVAQGNETEALVVAVGAGRLMGDTGVRRVLAACPGERVLFPAHAWKPLSDDLGMLDEEDLAAIRDHWGDVTPANDYVKITPLPREQVSAGGIIIPERARKRSRAGRIDALGSGKLRVRGPLAGLRASCAAVMGMAEGDTPVGRIAHWDADAVTLTVSGDGVKPFVLVRCGDIVALEETP